MWTLSVCGLSVCMDHECVYVRTVWVGCEYRDCRCVTTCMSVDYVCLCVDLVCDATVCVSVYVDCICV